MASNFTIGQTYNTFATRGLFRDSGDRLAISENKTTEGQITPENPAVYLGKKYQIEQRDASGALTGVDASFVGQHAFMVTFADGTQEVVKGHPNHFDPNTPYNISKRQNAAKASVKSAPAIPVTPASLEEQESLLMQKLAALKAQKAILAEEQANIPVDAPVAVQSSDTMSQDDMDATILASIQEQVGSSDADTSDDENDEGSDEVALTEEEQIQALLDSEADEDDDLDYNLGES